MSDYQIKDYKIEFRVEGETTQLDIHQIFYTRAFISRFRAPLPSDMNVVARYYIDWIIQFCGGGIYFVFLLLTALFFIGMCLYIARMVDDLRIILNELDKATTQQIITEIIFHDDLLR